MKKFKNLVMVNIVGCILVIACMLLMYVGYNTSELRLILFILLILLMNYTAFLIYYFFKYVRGSKI